MYFLSLSSGSSGNCYYIGDGTKGLLIDAGVSMRQLKRVFQLNGLSINSFGAILVTHDHMDHIRNIGSYCKHLCRPVYSKSTVHAALAHHTTAVPYIHSCRRELVCGIPTIIEGFEVSCFTLPHDATDNIGYFINTQDHKIVIMTDIGRMTPEALEYAKLADTVIIESNYDVDMLMSGPYTHELKMRICSGNGHLSNDGCAEAVAKFYHDGLKHLYLCHLSENNNTPKLAYECTKKALENIGVPSETIDLRTLPRTSPSTLIEL